MTDPLDSIAEEAAGNAPVAPDGSLEPEAEPQGPTIKDRAIELFLPCPEDPMDSAGEISRWVNDRLAQRSGLESSKIQVGENLAHCVNHLFPGDGTQGWPPIVNLARSIMAYRDLAHRNPDNGNLVRR